MLKVTILIINHNYGHWVSDAINSALAQDYPEKQLMIVDDGSKDNSLDVITKLVGIQNYKVGELAEGKVGETKVKLYSHPNALGPSAARNSGIKLSWAETDIYSVLDSDDIYKPGRVSKTILPFLDNPVVGLVYSDYDTLCSHSGVFRREYKEPFSINRLFQECIIHSASVISKKAFEDVGVYRNDMRTCEDFELFCRICKKYVAVHVPESLMIVRNHPTNSTNTVAKEIWNENWRKVTQTIMSN